jgi:hypothetical protein
VQKQVIPQKKYALKRSDLNFVKLQRSGAFELCT